MDNLEAIALWKPFANGNYAGDVAPSESPDVSFWFANSGGANEHFLCFGHGGDGSLLAVQAVEGKFESGVVVHLGHEGEVFAIAEDVPHALALLAASGENYEALLYAVAASSSEEQSAPNSDLAAFVRENFSLEIPPDPVKAILATDAKHGSVTRELVEMLNGA